LKSFFIGFGLLWKCQMIVAIARPLIMILRANIILEWYVNVADNARVHVAALLLKSVNHERIYASAAPFTWNQILAKLRALYPGKKFADDNPEAELSKISWPNERGEQLLKDVFGRTGWTGIEDTVVDNVKGLM